MRRNIAAVRNGASLINALLGMIVMTMLLSVILVKLRQTRDSGDITLSPMFNTALTGASRLFSWLGLFAAGMLIVCFILPAMLPGRRIKSREEGQDQK